jgi:hypothetical protein
MDIQHRPHLGGYAMCVQTNSIPVADIARAHYKEKQARP